MSPDEPILPRTRDNIRRAEVMREFDVSSEEEWSPAEHALYLAPWREQLLDGNLGPWYGPTTESRYNEQMRRFNEDCRGGIGSPSLWDQSEYERMHSPRSVTKRATRAAYRADSEAMRAMVRRQGDELPRRELETYAAFYVDGLSERQTAKRLGVAETTVKGWIKSLRRRLKEQSR